MAGGYVGVLSVELHMPMAASLKDKRREVRRIKAGLAKRFACSVAEVDHHDRWQLARLTLSVTTREAGESGRLVEEALRWLECDPVAQVVSSARDLIPVEVEGGPVP